MLTYKTDDGFTYKMVGETRITFWWDSSLRLWTTFAVDKLGNQIGETNYANNKGELDQAIRISARELYTS